MIALDELTKTFVTPSGTLVAVDHVSLTVPTGETCVLLGPSGCGKTTTLKIVNRIVVPTSGSVRIMGRDTATVDTAQLRRGIGYVIQQIGLFPNMTVAENICVVPRLLGWDNARAKRRASELLEMMALDPAVYLDRYPNELSGGQAQRVGVARALAADPPVMLMDEPFGALDPINRDALQEQFLEMQRTLRKTILFVSHDIGEAIRMGDKVALLRDGRVEQFGSPDEILSRPRNAFVAEFFGQDRALKRLSLITVASAVDDATPGVAADAPTDRAAALMRESGVDWLAVTDGGRLSGMVRREDLSGKAGTCGEHSVPVAAAIDVDSDLRLAVSQMFMHGVDRLACVAPEGRFRGYLTLHGITERLGRSPRAADGASP